MHIAHALLCLGASLLNPYPSGLLPWHWGNHMIAPVPVKQPWRTCINTPEPAINWNNKTTTNQSTTKPCIYFMGCDILPECLGAVTQFSYFLVIHNVHMSHDVCTSTFWWNPMRTPSALLALCAEEMHYWPSVQRCIIGSLCRGDALLTLCAEEMHYWPSVQRRCIIDPLCRGDALLTLCAEQMHYWPYVQRRCIIGPLWRGDALLRLCADEMHYWPYVQRRCIIGPLWRADALLTLCTVSELYWMPAMWSYGDVIVVSLNSQLHRL